MKIYESVEELVGKTPLIELKKTEKNENLKSSLFAKVEFFNPGGSIKDRAALNMLDDAEKNGKLKKGGTVIEPTSGNTGIGLSMLCAVRGFRAVIVMPDTMSPERIKLMRAYGAEVVLTDGRLGMAGAIKKAEEINRETEGSIIAGQFYNPANAESHFLTTGPEIFEDTDGKVDIAILAVGSGGTITGIGRYLKKMNPEIKIVGVEPSESAILSGGKAGAHGIQGIGAGFVPEGLDVSVIDEVVSVSTAEAYEYTAKLCKTEGLLCGISSGAALRAAIKVGSREESSGKNIVVVLPDTGSRYLSGDLF